MTQLAWTLWRLKWELNLDSLFLKCSDSGAQDSGVSPSNSIKNTISQKLDLFQKCCSIKYWMMNDVQKHSNPNFLAIQPVTYLLYWLSYLGQNGNQASILWLYRVKMMGLWTLSSIYRTKAGQTSKNLALPSHPTYYTEWAIVASQHLQH
jgi:hypothetical protein